MQLPPDEIEIIRVGAPYRSAMPERRVRDILALHAGSQFDPEVVRVFLSILIPETTTGLDLEPLARVTKA
jgi:response regulator RpfG family c-di-GMP phosphodiesterase